MPLSLSDTSFQGEVLESEVPVLVDFWAPWCKPCNVLSPVVSKVSDECPDCKVGKLNIDENPEITARYKIGAIPTLLFFKGGKEVKRLVGLQEAQVLTETLQNLK